MLKKVYMAHQPDPVKVEMVIDFPIYRKVMGMNGEVHYECVVVEDIGSMTVHQVILGIKTAEVSSTGFYEFDSAMSPEFNFGLGSFASTKDEFNRAVSQVIDRLLQVVKDAARGELLSSVGQRVE